MYQFDKSCSPIQNFISPSISAKLIFDDFFSFNETAKCQKTKRIPTPLANPDQHASSMISSFHHSHSSTDSSSFQSSSNSSLPTHNSYRVISRIPSSAPSQNPSTSTSTDVQKAASNTVSFKSTRDPLTNKIVIKSVSRHKKGLWIYFHPIPVLKRTFFCLRENSWY